MTLTQAALAILGLSAASAFAEEAEKAEEELENIVVTGSRTTDQVSEIPTTMSVIRLDELEARNPVNVPDALRSLPGIHIVQPSGQGGVARLFIRGGDQNLTMILLDGVRVNDPNDSRGSAFDFSTINVNDVERIEIVRGPQSAVYGSDALAGVINIISKGPVENFTGTFFAEGGSDDYFRGAIDLAGPLGTGGYSLRIATKDDGEPVSRTTFGSDLVSARLSFGHGNGWDLRFFGSYTDSDGTAFPEDSGGAELAVIREPDSRSAKATKLGATGGFSLSDRWKLNYLATWYDQDTSFLSPGVAPGVREGVPPNGADSKLERADVALNTVVEISDALTATVGMDYYDEDGVSDGFVEFFPGFSLPAGFDFSRDVMGIFAELHYSTGGGATIMASVRRDDSSNESAETTANFGFLYELSNGRTTLSGNWGQGFNLPGFFALASPLVGNPDLRPETSTSYDIGLMHRFADPRARLSLALFHNEFSDLIDFEASVFQMINRDQLDVNGVEVQFEYEVNESLRLVAQATYLDLDLRNDDSDLRQRPDWRGGLGVRWAPSDAWLIDAAWLYSGETYDTSIPTGDSYLDGYSRIDVTTTYRVSDKFKLVASVDNLLDEKYFEAIGFPAIGARARLGLRYEF